MKESAVGSTSYRLSLLQAGETWLVASRKAYHYFVSVPKSVLDTSMDSGNWYNPMGKRRSVFWYPGRKLVVGIERTQLRLSPSFYAVRKNTILGAKMSMAAQFCVININR